MDRGKAAQIFIREKLRLDCSYSWHVIEIKIGCRWSITKEYAGFVNQRFVCRFCGDAYAFVETMKEATKLELAHFINQQGIS